MDSEIYQLYKPLRNHLRLVSVENALYVIWAYTNHFQFQQSFPEDIQIHPSILYKKNIPDRPIYEWELSLLSREILSNSQPEVALATKNFNSWKYFGRAIQKLKEFENNVWPVIGGPEFFRHELRRISHRQFPWQFKITTADFVRYYKIYSNPRICNWVEKTLNITIQDWYTIGTTVFGAALTNPKMTIKEDIPAAGITKENFSIFASFTSTNIDQFKSIIEKYVKYDDEYVYLFNPLEYYPLVKIGEYYYCPIVNFLVWRITSGLFFDLIKNDGNFGRLFGLSFQDYLLEVSEKVLDQTTTTVKPENKYKVGKDEKDSVDIILFQENYYLFVEAKTKRMQGSSKVQLLSDSAINKDLDILADDIVQAYLTLNDYKNGYYEHVEYKDINKTYLLIVTLEDWFLLGEDLSDLEKRVSNKIKEKGLPDNIYSDSPYVLCSTRTYEFLVQVLNKVPIRDIFNNWFDPTKKGHDFGNFIVTTYGQDCKLIDDFFPGDFEKIYPEGIRKILAVDNPSSQNP